MVKKICFDHQVQKTKSTAWATAAGVFKTGKKFKVIFQLLEYFVKTEIVLDFHVHENNQLGSYDMILGHDMFNDLKIKLVFENKIVCWENENLPMKNNPEVQGMTKEEMFSTFMSVVESKAVRNATEHITKILDAS